MKTLLSSAELKPLISKLADANAKTLGQFPQDSGHRQPVHTVYGGAHLFRADTAHKLGLAASKSFNENAPDANALAQVFQLAPELRDKIYSSVSEKLKKEAVEDFRIDFEDGYGIRGDQEEDKHAQMGALEVSQGLKDGLLPPFIGIRIKPLNEELKARSLRTLDIFMTHLLEASGGRLPKNFFITLPKITSLEQVEVLVAVLDQLEKKSGLTKGTLVMEAMIETPQSVILPEGTLAPFAILQSARGRLKGAHFGTYDYTAAMNITASYQNMAHPSCDFAKNIMQVALAGTGVWLSDGATNVMPVGSQESIHNAWRLAFAHIRHSLSCGFYQGWDLHPAQLPARYTAVYSFFLEGLLAATGRLKNFVEKAAQATLVGDVFDDAATGQGLLNYFLRAINCGAIEESEALATGLSLEEIRSKSFMRILDRRKQKS